MEKKENRDAWIDLGKFLGILFVLMNHTNLRILGISTFGGMFYVAIFFVLSGYTYHKREETWTAFIVRKARRLLIPYFGFNMFLFIFFFMKDNLFKMDISVKSLKSLIGILYSRNSFYYPVGEHTQSLFTLLNSPTWFLTALFVSLIFFEMGIRISRGDCKKMGLYSTILFTIGLYFHYFVPIMLPFSIDSSFLFEGLIFLGYFLSKENRMERIAKKKITYVIIPLLLIPLGLYNGSSNLSIGDFGYSVFVGILISYLSSLLVMCMCYLLKDHIPEGIKWIGQSSLQIMCLHLFVFMFVQGFYQVVFPEKWNQMGMITDFANIFMICITLDIITFLTLGYKGMRRQR